MSSSSYPGPGLIFLEPHQIPTVSLDPLTRPTLPIPEAGQYFGLDRNAAYRAARQGYLPTVQVSERRWVVPTAALLKMLGMGGE